MGWRGGAHRKGSRPEKGREGEWRERDKGSPVSEATLVRGDWQRDGIRRDFPRGARAGGRSRDKRRYVFLFYSCDQQMNKMRKSSNRMLSPGPLAPRCHLNLIF